MPQLWLVFVLGAVLSWGAYGPALEYGRSGFPDRATASLRALLCVGLAYFLVGVLVPLGVLGAQGQMGGFNAQGSAFSLLAGLLGALGAVCIIWAFKNGGKAEYVMPLVFGGAPVVNAIISVVQKGSEAERPHPLFFVGILAAGAGAFLVLSYKPS